MQKTLKTSQVTNQVMNRLRLVSIGIMSGKSISFVFNGTFMFENKEYSGRQNATVLKDKVYWNGRMYNSLEFVPINAEAMFTLCDVTIGKQFHWERKEDETFAGKLKIIPHNEELYAINEIDVEEYLTSVISSEMSATSSLEFLRAQAVVSRSWLMRILLSRKKKAVSFPCDKSMQREKDLSKQSEAVVGNENSRIVWYENDAHTLFDVCADDHCQRYEGITRAVTNVVREAVFSTRGEVLMYKGHICDARFSKCCGGVSEIFSSCWDNHDEEYLLPVRDNEDDLYSPKDLPDLSDEHTAEVWIRSVPEAFCNTSDKTILSQVLNDYDYETKDFYRWRIFYTQEELSSLISKKTGIDFGYILNLIPMQRGKSGRIINLQIHGTKRDIIIGKELEIRRVLSSTHLKSSAFIVECKDISTEGIPSAFELLGAGWGHGVGMCQIGAAVMAAEGHGYKTILKHYYKNSEIKTLYE